VEYNTFNVVIRTLRCRLFGRTDIGRWRDTETFDDWKERTRLISKLVPEGTCVIEFGVGKRQLEAEIDKKCSYIPSDIVDRGPNTLVIDLNARPLPDLRTLNLDVAVFAGVLEYICDLNSLVFWLSQQAMMCVVSYQCSQTRPHSLARFREAIRRTGAGWVNTLTEEELIETFRFRAFALTEQKHTADGESIFVFRRPTGNARAQSDGRSPPNKT
jgi:hypothetical protein